MGSFQYVEIVFKNLKKKFFLGSQYWWGVSISGEWVKQMQDFIFQFVEYSNGFFRNEGWQC